MNRLATLALAGVLLAACSIGAPPGFSGGNGNSWTFPLVGPLEDGLLVTPVFINDQGPYLMGIDTDSPTSQVDSALVGELKLFSGLGPKMLDESDTNRPSHAAEVKSFKLGTLTVRNRRVTVMPPGTFGAAGRHLRGIIGRDVIADSLVFGFDRERGVAFLATQAGFTPPAEASTMSYDIITNRLRVEFPPTARRVSTVMIGDKKFKMHLDLGAVTSQLRKGLWEKAGLSTVPVETEMRDEVGSTRTTNEAGAANAVVTGQLTASGVLFAPYGDKRWEEEDVDGTLALNFFRTLNVSANWDQETFYLIPRGDVAATTKERVERWGAAAIASCENVGCVGIQMIEPTAPAPEPATAPGTPGASAAPGASGPPGGGAGAPVLPRPVVVLTRDASAKGLDLEIVLAAVGADGAPSELPRLVVNLPKDVDTLSNQLDPSYTGIKLVVIDLSPYPRACGKPTGCIQSLPTTR
jgi:hypothetical protein